MDVCIDRKNLCMRSRAEDVGFTHKKNILTVFVNAEEIILLLQLNLLLSFWCPQVLPNRDLIYSTVSLLQWSVSVCSKKLYATADGLVWARALGQLQTDTVQKHQPFPQFMC